MTASEIQTAISLIPSTDNTKTIDAESNIDISGDEDDFDDVFLIENGEVFRQDVDAILAALEEAARERDGDLLDSVPLNLPEPPSCFADESRSLFNDHHVSKNDSFAEGNDNSTNSITSDIPRPSNLRGPRITKPDFTSIDKGSKDESENVKAVRGRRKLLYPGSRLSNKTCSSVSSKSVSKVQPAKKSQMATKASPGNRQTISKPSTSKSRGVSKKGADATEGRTVLSPSSKLNATSSKSASQIAPSSKSVRRTIPTANTRVGKTNPSGKSSGIGVPSAQSSVPKEVASADCQKSSRIAASAKRSNIATIRPHSFSKNADSNATGGKTLADDCGTVDVRSTDDTAVADASKDGRPADSRGKVVSPSCALHRAAGLYV